MRRTTAWQLLSCDVWVFSMMYLLTVALRSAIRGSDYLRQGDEGISRTLGVAVNVMSLDSWGWLFILVALVLVVGVVGQWWTTIICGCALGAVAYGYITVAMTIEVIRLDTTIWRTPADTGFTAVLLTALTVSTLIRMQADRVKKEMQYD